LDFSNKFIVIKAGANGATNFATPAAAEAAKAVTWNYGNFITASVNFLIIAFAIFLLVRALHKLKHPPADTAPTVKDCPACTMSIPIKATRCPHCTSELAASPA
jgi:large conductance mechanosensitive channel